MRKLEFVCCAALLVPCAVASRSRRRRRQRAGRQASRPTPARGRDAHARVGSDIFIGDLVQTGPQGQVQILFADNTELVLGPSSSLTIEDYLIRNDGSAGKFAVDMLVGRLPLCHRRQRQEPLHHRHAHRHHRRARHRVRRLGRRATASALCHPPWRHGDPLRRRQCSATCSTISATSARSTPASRDPRRLRARSTGEHARAPTSAGSATPTTSRRCCASSGSPMRAIASTRNQSPTITAPDDGSGDRRRPTVRRRRLRRQPTPTPPPTAATPPPTAAALHRRRRPITPLERRSPNRRVSAKPAHAQAEAAADIAGPAAGGLLGAAPARRSAAGRRHPRHGLRFLPARAAARRRRQPGARRRYRRSLARPPRPVAMAALDAGNAHRPADASSAPPPSASTCCSPSPTGWAPTTTPPSPRRSAEANAVLGFSVSPKRAAAGAQAQVRLRRSRAAIRRPRCRRSPARSRRCRCSPTRPPGLGGLSLNAEDSAGVVRRVPLLWSDGTTLYPGLSLEALRLALGVDDARGARRHRRRPARSKACASASSRCRPRPSGDLVLYDRPPDPGQVISAWRRARRRLCIAARRDRRAASCSSAPRPAACSTSTRRRFGQHCRASSIHAAGDRPDRLRASS